MFKRNNLILVGLFLILIIFGTWHLATSPATWFDEGINLGIAKSLVQNGVYNLEIGPNEFVAQKQFLITSNYPVLLPVALSIKIFGANFLAGRLLMVLFLILFSVAAYFLVKKLYSKEAAIMSVALIVSFTPFYGNGKDVLGEIPGLFYFLCALIGLARSDFLNAQSIKAAENPADEIFRRGRAKFSQRSEKILGLRKFQMRDFWWLIAAGFFVGLSAATKPFFLLVPIAILIGEIIFGWRNFPNLIKRLLLMFLGALLPIVAWLYTILPSFTFVGFKSAVFYYSNSYASENISQLILQNFLRFFKETTPIHFAFLFLISLAAWILIKKRGGHMEKYEIIFLTFILLTLVFYLKTPGWYRYFFPAHMILFLVFPAALLYLLRSRQRIAAAIVVLLFLFQLGYTISQRNTNLYNSDEAIILSNYISQNVSAGSQILIINAPSIAFAINNFRTYQFLQINPVLFFGHNSFDSDGGVYLYVVTRGDLSGLDFPDLSKTLSEKYQLEKEVGHYSLYKSL